MRKVEQLAKTFKGDIAVDGGINAATAPLCVKAGAGVLVTASYLYGAKDLKGTVQGLKISGQTALEYMILFAIVAVVVFAGFKTLLPQVQNSSEGYYNSVANVIMGENPNPINGGWCPPSPSGQRACLCPAPAFGGAPCP